MTGRSILIADDEEVNRQILAMYFKNDYRVILACNGAQAIKALKEDSSISIVLLDLIMPVCDGFTVLKTMHELGLVGLIDSSGRYYNKVPVICITSADDEDTMAKVFNLYADELFGKPFSAIRVKNRVHKMIELASYRTHSEKRISLQSLLLSRQNDELMDTLSNLVEYRSQETGEHTKRIRHFTKILLSQYKKECPELSDKLTADKIELIAKASVLHDIGKQFIPESILNAPRRLTPEEFGIIKTHSIAGYKIIKDNFHSYDEHFLDYAKQITLYHHERYDGKGYPSIASLREANIQGLPPMPPIMEDSDGALGLKGEDIPLSAQVVAIADVYDALVGKRCYKKQFPHEVACRMIEGGECGAFSPKILECFRKCSAEFLSYGKECSLYAIEDTL